jgi:hypothetical protein
MLGLGAGAARDGVFAPVYPFWWPATPASPAAPCPSRQCHATCACTARVNAHQTGHNSFPHHISPLLLPFTRAHALHTGAVSFTVCFARSDAKHTPPAYVPMVVFAAAGRHRV